jgi:hypothetical protein
MALAAALSSCSSASVGTSTSTRTRESPSSLVVVLTAAGMAADDSVRPVAPLRRSAPERLHAWLVTGPPGHLWSALADIVVLLARALLARLRLKTS